MKTLLVILMSVLVATSANAMVREVSLGYLAHNADLIVRAEIEFTKTVGTLPSGVSVIANQAIVKAVIKGDIKVDEKIRIKTYGNAEDLPTFEAGKLMVLFLKKVDNYYEIFCGIQGVWPIKEGKYLAFGSGKTTEDIKNALEKPETPKFENKINKKHLIKVKLPLIATPTQKISD